MILFYNVVYVYVYKIGEETFGGWWRSFSWLGQSNPVVWHPHCTVSVTVPTNQLDYCFSSGRFKG